MINRVELKQNAKKSLAGHYADAVVVILLSGIIAGFTGGIQGFGQGINNVFLSSLGYLLSFAVSAFLNFGMLSFYLKISRNEETDYRELFNKFNMFVPYIVISLLTSIFVMLWSILFIIPGIIASFAYSQVYLIALDNPEMDGLEVLKCSKEMMYGYKLEYFILQLSFLGWIILGIFTCGILYLWLMPYIYVTNCNFYNKLKENYENKKGLKKENKSNESKAVIKGEEPKVVTIPSNENKKKEEKKVAEKKKTTSSKKSTTKEKDSSGSKKSTTPKSKTSSTKKTAPAKKNSTANSGKTAQTKKSTTSSSKTTTPAKKSNTGASKKTSQAKKSSTTTKKTATKSTTTKKTTPTTAKKTNKSTNEKKDTK